MIPGRRSSSTERERSMKFRPLHDRVVVRRIEADAKTKGGIIIPDTVKEKPQEGEVVAVGPGGRDENGKITPTELKPGERILFGKWSGTEVKIDGEELLIMKETDVMGVIEGATASKTPPRRPPKTKSIFQELKDPNPWQPKMYVSLPTPATACCAASISSTTPSR